MLAAFGLAGSYPACLDRKVYTEVHAASAVPYGAAAQPPELGAPPAAVTSQALGSGVICDSSLYVNQYVLTGDDSCMVSCVGLLTVRLWTSSGSAPGEYPAQLDFSAWSMFIQNTTSWAVTVSPFDHL